MGFKFRLVPIVFVGLGVLASWGVASAEDNIYVANRFSGSVTVLGHDTTVPGAAVIVRNTLTGLSGPQDIDVRPDGKWLAVSNSTAASITIFNLTANPPSPGSVALGGSTPYGVHFRLPGGDRLYVSNAAAPSYNFLSAPAFAVLPGSPMAFPTTLFLGDVTTSPLTSISFHTAGPGGMFPVNEDCGEATLVPMGETDSSIVQADLTETLSLSSASGSLETMAGAFSAVAPHPYPGETLPGDVYFTDILGLGSAFNSGHIITTDQNQFVAGAYSPMFVAAVWTHEQREVAALGAGGACITTPPEIGPYVYTELNLHDVGGALVTRFYGAHLAPPRVDAPSGMAPPTNTNNVNVIAGSRFDAIAVNPGPRGTRLYVCIRQTPVDAMGGFTGPATGQIRRIVVPAGTEDPMALAPFPPVAGLYGGIQLGAGEMPTAVVFSRGGTFGYIVIDKGAGFGAVRKFTIDPGTENITSVDPVGLDVNVGVHPCAAVVNPLDFPVPPPPAAPKPQAKSHGCFVGALATQGGASADWSLFAAVLLLASLLVLRRQGTVRHG